MEYDENTILNELLKLDGMDFWKYEANLTGVYVMGRVKPSGTIFHWSDCTGMRISYYGSINQNYYITSHTNIVAELCNLYEDSYIQKLRSSRYFRLFGNVLPADLSTYKELRRTVPNHIYGSDGSCRRFFPFETIKECKDEREYRETVETAADLLKKTLAICSEKWKGMNVAISLTGGKDSGVTFSSANGIYKSFQVFSYISKKEESVDAYAAKDICKRFGLDHRIIQIPNENKEIENFDLINEIIYVNGGSIGYIKPNEVRKRSVLINDPSIDVEIKSWVNEITRAYWYKKYGVKKFPKKPNGRMLASLYKVFLENRILFRKTAKVFSEYIKKFMSKDDIKLFGDWTTLWSWEFGFSAGEGQSLIAEHLLAFDITIPFNNRHLISLMLKPSINDRIDDRLQMDIIKRNNKEQYNLGINIVNVAHTSKRAKAERAYLWVNTHLPF